MFKNTIHCGFLTAILFLCVLPDAHSQTYEPFPLQNTHHRHLHSTNTDYEYGIYVYMPPSYNAETDRVYPTIYMLDGESTFTYAGEIERSLLWGAEINEFIIVGIGYEGQNMRGRDFTFGGGASSGQRGGAENFFRFITEELVPVIERDYRTASEGRTLFGHSLGGGFTLYTMLNHTDAFDSYIASSPATGGLDAFEAAYANTHTDLPVKCFISSGILEGDAQARRFSSILKSRDYPGFKIQELYFESGSHCTMAPYAYTEGVRLAFGREISVPPEVLAQYAGRYEGENFTITIQFAGDNLIVNADGTRGSNALYPASRTVFFTKGWPGGYTFTLDANGVPTGIISRGSTTAQKVE